MNHTQTASLILARIHAVIIRDIADRRLDALKSTNQPDEFALWSDVRQEAQQVITFLATLDAMSPKV